MKLNLLNAIILDPESSFHRKKTNLQVENGKIVEISEALSSGASVDLEGCFISPGFLDLCSSFCDPGFEHKEDIFSGLDVARDGGFTQVCVNPTTYPVVDSKNSLEYLLSKSRNHISNILPFAQISRGGNEEDLSELRDLHTAGAVAFKNGENPIQNTELLAKSLEYAKAFGGLIINHPRDKFLTASSQIHEGKISTELGLKGFPAIAESLMIERDLMILKYSGGRLHFSGISTAEAVESIRQAKSSGLPVTCDVPISNLVFTDDMVAGFDTNFKLNPPLRTIEHQKALINGLAEGVIDAVSSFHSPQDSESKELEFDLAEFGALNLQTVLPSLLNVPYINGDLDILPSIMHYGPSKVLGNTPNTIAIGKQVNLTIFNPEYKWTFDKDTNLSLSKNSPYFGEELKGKSMGIVSGSGHYFHKSITLIDG